MFLAISDKSARTGDRYALGRSKKIDTLYWEVMLMLITELFRAKALLSTQREAIRLLDIIISSLDAVPSSDGSVRFTFRGNIEFLDRLAIWNASVEDDEDFSDHEADSRDPGRRGSTADEVAIEAAHRHQPPEPKSRAA